MQQPQKKRDPRTMASRAYTLFKRAERTNKRLTLDMICQYTGYSERTAKAHLSKKWRRHFLHADGAGGYTVNGLSSISKAEFLGWHSQLAKKSVAPATVDRYYRLEPGSIDMYLVIVVLILAGIWWQK